jgi:putative two-component system response regulator
MSHSATILIVDDIAANRETLRELLDMPGYEIIEAANGPTALRLARETPPDLVLLDVMMPCMGGYEVCRRMRADPALADVPIIMVTALDDPESVLAGLEAGADDFLTKPVNGGILRARVRTRLNRYRRLVDSLRACEERFRVMFDLLEQKVAECTAQLEAVNWESQGEIKERKQIEVQLRDFLKEIGDLKSALDEQALVAITDSQGKITCVNEGGTQKQR